MARWNEISTVYKHIFWTLPSPSFPITCFSLGNLFRPWIIGSYEVVSFAENGWISAATNCIHLPFIVSVVGNMSVAYPDPVMAVDLHVLFRSNEHNIWLETYLGILSISPSPNRLKTNVTFITSSPSKSSLWPNNITCKSGTINRLKDNNGCHDKKGKWNSNDDFIMLSEIVIRDRDIGRSMNDVDKTILRTSKIAMIDPNVGRRKNANSISVAAPAFPYKCRGAPN